MSVVRPVRPLYIEISDEEARFLESKRFRVDRVPTVFALPGSELALLSARSFAPSSPPQVAASHDLESSDE